MSRKTEGWQIRLAAYLNTCAPRPLEYGQHDCAIFAAGAVQAMTGLDLAEGWRGRYSTLRGGLRVLRAQGYADQVALAAAHLPEIGTPRPGDLAVIETPHGPAIGVVQGAMVYVTGEDRLSLVPVGTATRFFEV